MVDPEFFAWWRELVSSHGFITGSLIVVASLIGGAAPFIREGKPFNFWFYLFEVFTSAIAGVVVWLILKVTETPPEWIAAASGVSAYFGTKMMALFLRLGTKYIERKGGAESVGEGK